MFETIVVCNVRVTDFALWAQNDFLFNMYCGWTLKLYISINSLSFVQGAFKCIKTETVLTKTEMNHEWNINFLLNSLFII